MMPDPKTIVGRRGRVAVLNLEDDVIEHAHPQSQVLIKIDGPDRIVVVGDRRYVLSDDTMIMLPPWVAHAGMALAVGSTSVLSVNVGVPASTMHAASQGEVICRVLDPGLRRAACDLKDRLLRSNASNDDADEMLASFSETYSRGYDSHSSTTIDFRIRKVVEHIRSGPADAQNVEAWIHVGGLSRQHFFHLFRECIGVTPRLYANSIRLERALDRLSRSTTPIHLLSQSLGFRAPSHFTRFFVENFGSTPRAYRRGAYVVADRVNFPL